MKRLIGLIAVILITATSASGLVNTNAVNITVGDTAGHNYKQFDFTWSGFDDQYITFGLDRVITNHTWTFKLTKDTITGQVAYVSQAASVSTSNITLSLSRTNVPPNASYKASLRGVDATSTLGIDVARGKVSVTDSLFDDADGTYVFPATLDVDAADTSYVNAAGDGMTGGLTNTTARGFVGNGGNLTNVTIATGLAVGTSANLNTVINDQTGSGLLVFGTSPTLITPALGIPASGNFLNCTNLPIATGLKVGTSANLNTVINDQTGSGALVFANSPILVTPALGTPASGTLTSCSGLPIAGMTGTSSEMKVFLGDGDSANLRDAIDDETGSGLLVFGTSPTLSGTTLIEGSLDLGTVETFAEVDDHPDVSSGSYFNTHTTSETITDFDGSGIVDGQIITVFSKGAITFDSSTHLRSGSANLVTASGDVTTWMYDGTDWVLLSFMDDSENVSLSAYGELGAAETIAGNWVNTANPWADNEVADALTVAEAGIAAAITRDSEWNSFSALNSALSTKTLINEEDSVIFDNQVNIGDGTPTVISGAGELYVTGDLEVGGSTVLISGGDVQLTTGVLMAEVQVLALGASSPVTLTENQARGSFATVSAAATVNLPSAPTVGMQVTLLAINDIVITIADNKLGDVIWKDGSEDSNIANSGSAGECIMLTYAVTNWYAHTIEGSWILQ